jgi:hypothetical protein
MSNPAASWPQALFAPAIIDATKSAQKISIKHNFWAEDLMKFLSVSALVMANVDRTKMLALA